MNDAAPSSPVANAGPVEEADLCAVLVIDATGKIVAANGSACHLWSAPDRWFAGLPYAGLFAFEVDSSDPEFLEVRWKAASTALNRWAPLTARPLGGPPRDVRVRLERALGGAGSYIATIQPRLRPAIGTTMERNSECGM